MYVDSPSERPGGGWSVGVHDAVPSELVRAFDPDQPYVVIEGHSPIGAGWRAHPVALTGDPTSMRTRTVRGVRFDLCLSPHEVIDAGPELDQSDQGWLYAWQVPRKPPQHLTLSQKHGPARTAAMRGVGVTLLIDLPHRRETAVLWSPDRRQLDTALNRLGH